METLEKQSTIFSDSGEYGDYLTVQPLPHGFLLTFHTPYEEAACVLHEGDADTLIAALQSGVECPQDHEMCVTLDPPCLHLGDALCYFEDGFDKLCEALS